MSHLAYDVTEDEVKEFFSPLETKNIHLLVRDGQPQGKANVLFNSHEDAVEAMKKDQTECGTWRVNLYLDSTEGAAATPKPASNKISFVKSEELLNGEPADDTMNETAEADESTSEEPKKKFKWDKMIKSALKAAEGNTLSVKKLRKLLLPQYTEKTGEECGKAEFKDKLDQRLNKSSKFTYEDGNVSM